MECYISSMKQSQQILPVQCVRCGASFDLWHDLLQVGDGKEEIYEALSDMKEDLCWRCRAIVAGELESNNENVEETEKFGLDEDFDFNLVLNE